MRPWLLFLVTALAFATPVRGAETARQILDRRKALDDGERRWDDRKQTLKFTLKSPSGSEKVRDFKLAEKRYPADERKAIVFFLSPADVKGVAFLAFNHKGKAADQWLYLPATSIVRRISGGSRRDSFVGSDLTFRDLDILTEMPSWTEDDAASSLRAEETVDGVACHVIEYAPKRDDIGYKKIVLWLGKDDLVPRKLELYDEGAEPTKRIAQSDIRKVDKIPVAYTTTVETPAARTATTVTVVDNAFNQHLSDDVFTQAALEQGPQ
jgi:hypothetical protein